MVESLEELEAQHRKELKGLDGEKRAAVKKIKGTKGKKAKDELAALEVEFEDKLKLMHERHDEERRLLAGTVTNDAHPGDDGHRDVVEPSNDEREQERLRKAEKARLKREKAREKERDREQRIAEEMANAGPSARDVENEIISRHLAPLNLRIEEVAADGHCLYRAVAAHCGRDFSEMRSICADVMVENEEEFAPFCEFSDDAPDFRSYVDRVRSSADWGGHLELRALAIALKRPIVIYSAQSSEPLRIEEQLALTSDPIRLSFHLNYYALGEHYNQVVAAEEG